MTTAIQTSTKELYAQAITELQEQFSIKNRLAAPRIAKVSLNMGVGRAIADNQILPVVTEHLTQLAGQRAVVTIAKKAVAQFRSREGNKIGCRVTLRGERMWSFLDKLIGLAIPRIKDFRGISPKGFDKQGNYSMGLTEQALFPEVTLEKIEHNQGLNITICIENTDPEKSLVLLKGLGMPFRER
ncbi:MAG: 50S ribosomal protein L5 [Planctomycetota bacterium]|jgi:large subunit ribosomal protein L5|nr:50S ribosomal protein L5 [Planctomycetota bacterium]